MDYYALDQEISAIEQHIKLLYYIKPINLLREQKKFLAHPTYNPQFEYRPIIFNPSVIEKQLKNLKTDRTPLGMIFRHKIDSIILRLRLLKAIGDPANFTAASEELYGKITSLLLNKARKNRRKQWLFPASCKRYTALETQEILQSIFRRYNLAHWRVHIKKSLVSDCTANKKNVMLLKAKARFSKHRIERLIAHEIETHIFTAENGKLQPYKIFNTGLAHYLETQEGLALFAQAQKNKYPGFIHSWSAISVLAVAGAYESSFANVYKKLRHEGLSQKQALRLTVRVKRGICDTSQPGVFTKDLIYFSGAEKMTQFARGKGDFRKLFIGKVAIQDLPFISKIPHLVAPKYLPTWVHERHR